MPRPIGVRTDSWSRAALPSVCGRVAAHALDRASLAALDTYGMSGRSPSAGTTKTPIRARTRRAAHGHSRRTTPRPAGRRWLGRYAPRLMVVHPVIVGLLGSIVNAPQYQTVRHKPCAACGAQFECCAGGCWCDAVSLTEQTRAQLLAVYMDCLCPTCLREHASAPPVTLDV